jgi:hypothetical protein
VELGLEDLNLVPQSLRLGGVDIGHCYLERHFVTLPVTWADGRLYRA